MDDRGRNEGIVVSGGTIQAGALAVGRRARASQVVQDAGRSLAERGQSEVAERLEQLLRELEAHAAQLSNADEVRESTELLARELAKPAPNRTTVSGVLGGIVDSVKSVAGLAGAAQALAQAIAHFF